MSQPNDAPPTDQPTNHLGGMFPDPQPADLTVESTPAPPVARGNSDPRMFTEAEINAAREQEKSKMYSRLETMQETVNRLQAAETERARLQTETETQAQAQARADAEADMTAKDLLAEREREWNARFSALEAERETERVLRQRESEYAALMDYQRQAVDAARDDIAPELLDLVHGSTPEEVNASIADMKTRTDAIMQQMQIAQGTARQQMPGTRITTPVSSGPEDGSAYRQYSADEIRAMNMEDYKKNRQRLLGTGASGGPTARGLFG